MNKSLFYFSIIGFKSSRQALSVRLLIKDERVLRQTFRSEI